MRDTPTVLRRLLPVAYVIFALLGVPAASHAAAPPWEPVVRASLEQMAAHLSRSLKPWPVPNRRFKADDYGAVPDGATVNTTALQKAIDACSAAGGGYVVLAKGRYVTGTIVLKSGVMLEVEQGAELLGSTNLADYPAHVSAHPTIMDTYMKLTLSLIYAEDCDRIGICGAGLIDGRGGRNNFPGPNSIGPVPGRPFGLRLIECRHVVVEGIHLKNSAAWMQNYLNCEEVIVRGITVENDGNWNNDGFDIDGCRNVLVRDTTVYSEDDGLCFKGAGLRVDENILVENCKFFSRANAMKFGTDSEGSFRNVLVRNVEMGSPAIGMPVSNGGRAISGVSWQAVDGGSVENVLVENAVINRADLPFCLRLGDRGRRTPGTARPVPGRCQNIVFENITGTDNGSRGSVVSGIPGADIRHVVFRSITLSLDGGGSAGDAAADISEQIDAYPDAGTFGPRLPAYGFWMRHVRRSDPGEHPSDEQKCGGASADCRRR